MRHRHEPHPTAASSCRHAAAMLLGAGLFAAAVCFTIPAASTAHAAQDGTNATRPMQIDDLFRFARLGDFDLSPDGKSVVYQVTHVDAEKNESRSDLFLAAVDGSSPPRQLTSSGKKDSDPKFSPDGRWVLFQSNRSGSGQLWLIAVAGGEAYQLTDLATEAGGGVWSRDGQRIVFSSSVFPDIVGGSDKEIADRNAARLKERRESPVKARTADHLFWRHWDGYVENLRQHLFVIEVRERNGRLAAEGSPHDATPGDRDAVPTSSTFSSGPDYGFGPDSRHLVFTAVPAKSGEPSYEAWSTGYDICHVAVNNTSPQWNTLTASNAAADSGPQFSPDGKLLAWRMQKTPGAEADRWVLVTQPVGPYGTLQGERREHPLRDDVSIDAFVWVDNDKLLAVTQWEGRHRVYRLSASQTQPAGEIVAGDLPGISKLQSVPGGGIIYAASSLISPAQLYVRNAAGDIRDLSRLNTELLASLDMPEVEWTAGVPIEDGYRLQMWIMKPPGFTVGKKYPTVYMIHGGPQGAWNDAWSYRWNPALWASQGYVVALPNPRGSTGFGQRFSEQISGDWGGKCYRDLMAGADWLETIPYVDATRMAAAGASFGGYMMNWFAVNTPRFCTLVSHCSVYNFESMWGTTDELWFDEFEHGGVPWEKPEEYRRFSPHVLAAKLGEYKTPMLVIHNDLDFRCPIGQGIELFTSLQRQGVPSRLVNFPDEGHWVTKPANARRWHQEVFAWLERYCRDAKPKPSSEAPAAAAADAS